MGILYLNGTTSGQIALVPPAVAGSNILSLPAATDTLVGLAATQTLTNKTLTSPTITGASVSSMASSVITSGTAQASTSGTSILFTGIPSWAKRVTVMFRGLSTSGSSVIQVQIGSGSLTTTGYLSGSSYTVSGSYGAYSSTTGLAIAGASSSNVRSGVMLITNISGNIWVSSHSGAFSDQAGALTGGGTVSLSGSLDRVNITTVNGTDTFTAGSINIFWE